jgi:chromosome segregation ATPase
VKPRVQEKIDEITLLIEKLRFTIKKTAKELESARDEQAAIREERLQLRKERTTLAHSAEEISSLQDENAALRGSVEQVRTTLQGLLSNVKSLRNEFRQ